MKVNEPDNTHTPSKAKVRTQLFEDDYFSTYNTELYKGCRTSVLDQE